MPRRIDDPFAGRWFMLRAIRKPWIKPEVRRFETAEELLASYKEGMPNAEFQKLARLAEQLQRSTRRNLCAVPKRRILR